MQYSAPSQNAKRPSRTVVRYSTNWANRSACTMSFAFLVFRVVRLTVTRNTRDANDIVHAIGLARKKRSSNRVFIQRRGRWPLSTANSLQNRRYFILFFCVFQASEGKRKSSAGTSVCRLASTLAVLQNKVGVRGAFFGGKFRKATRRKLLVWLPLYD